jgi:hypothetical protein
MGHPQFSYGREIKSPGHPPAYIIPEDTWYVIPIEAVRGTSLLFRRKRDRKPGLYDEYKEAWHSLRPR